MTRQRKPTTNRTTRYLSEIVEPLDKYAEDQLISSNAAVNKLLKERLTGLGYIQPTLIITKCDEEKLPKQIRG
jgi:hypothetical protein